MKFVTLTDGLRPTLVNLDQVIAVVDHETNREIHFVGKSIVVNETLEQIQSLIHGGEIFPLGTCGHCGVGEGKHDCKCPFSKG